jgi:flagellar hook capping protein FlgD
MPTGSRFVSPLFVFAAVSLFVAIPRIASAAWPPFGRAISTAVGDQLAPSISTDGAGGAIIAWVDFRGAPVNLFARRVLASGELDPAWPADGRALRTNPLALGTESGNPGPPGIVPDGSGGAIVIWEDRRSSLTAPDIFAQHVLASGAVDVAWPANGLAVSATEGVQNFPSLISDGAGGAIVTWMDGRPGTSGLDIYAQHVLLSGRVDPSWPANGVAVSAASGPQTSPTIVGDGSGGAIITWSDGRNATSSFDIYAQHLLHSGVVDPSWPVNGLAASTAPQGQFEPKIVSDGSHGAVITWYDNQNGSNRVFVLRVLASGVVDPAWPVNGRAVSVGTEGQDFPRLVSDGSGGAIVAWQERVGGVFGVLAAWAQHIKATGVVDPAWPVGGRVLGGPQRDQGNAVIGPDGAGGAIVAWQEGSAIKAGHVLASGTLDSAYSDSGRVVCDVPPSPRGSPAIVPVGAGGAIVAWEDYRSGGADIYAKQVLEPVTGVPGTPGLEFAFDPPGPNPALSATTLRFSLSRDANVRLAIFDASGRRVRELISGTQPAGAHVIGWDFRDAHGGSIAAGIYFARLDVGARSLTRKVIHLR